MRTLAHLLTVAIKLVGGGGTSTLAGHPKSRCPAPYVTTRKHIAVRKHVGVQGCVAWLVPGGGLIFRPGLESVFSVHCQHATT